MSDLVLAEGGQPEVLALDDRTGDALAASKVSRPTGWGEGSGR